MVAPFWAASTFWVAATSSSSEVIGISTSVTLKPLARSRCATLSQLDLSAKAPGTSTTLWAVAADAATGAAVVKAVARAAATESILIGSSF